MKRFFAVPCVVSLLLLASCSGEQPAKDTTPATASATVAPDDSTPRDGGTLYRRLDTDVSSLNPVLAQTTYDRRVAQYLFTPLVYLDENLRAAPGLAESWEISPDGKLYTFKLNEKATFVDKRPVRASDVIFTLRKAVDPNSAAAMIAGGFQQLDLANTRAVDDHTLVVAFRSPLASQMIRFAELYVVPEHAYGTGDFKAAHNDVAMGSGPYRLVRRVAGKEIVLERRADYWGERPHIQTVVFKLITDLSTAWQAVKRGDLDETVIASDTWVRERNSPDVTSKLDIRRFYTLNYNYIGWNGKHPIFSDKRVRGAIAKCINLNSVINDLYYGTARAVSGHFTPEEWAYNPNVPVVQFDPAAAKRELEAAGWRDSNQDGLLDKDGKPFRFDLTLSAGGGPGPVFAQMLQNDLERIGVEMNIVTLDTSTVFQRMLGGSFDAAYMSWELDPDPDPFAVFHSSQVPPAGFNFVHYVNPEADQLIEAGRRELDLARRTEIYHRLHAVLAADQPYAWTVQASSKWALNKRVRGVRESRGYGLLLWYPGELGWWLAS